MKDAFRLSLIICVFLFASLSNAQNHKQTLAGNEAIFEVHGIVCSFCSVGLQKKLSQLPSIDMSKYKKGVHVEIETQKVTIALKPDAKLDVKAAYEAIKSGGYEPVNVTIIGKNGAITTYNADGELCTATY